MKYIRTKDGKIYKTLEDYMQSDLPPTKIRVEDVAKDWHIIIYKSEVIKQADSIEELCDCFVKIKRKGNCKPYILKYDFKDLPVLKEQAIKYKDSPVYGAIHIEDKGLIYKAKLKGVLPNGEINWELL